MSGFLIRDKDGTDTVVPRLQLYKTDTVVTRLPLYRTVNIATKAAAEQDRFR